MGPEMGPGNQYCSKVGMSNANFQIPPFSKITTPCDRSQSSFLLFGLHGSPVTSQVAVDKLTPEWNGALTLHDFTTIFCTTRQDHNWLLQLLFSRLLQKMSLSRPSSAISVSEDRDSSVSNSVWPAINRNFSPRRHGLKWGHGGIRRTYAPLWDACIIIVGSATTSKREHNRRYSFSQQTNASKPMYVNKFYFYLFFNYHMLPFY